MADNSNLQSNQAANAMRASPFKEILTIKDATEFLSESKSYLYKQTSAQAIPHYKPTGKRCYFKRKSKEFFMRISTFLSYLKESPLDVNRYVPEDVGHTNLFQSQDAICKFQIISK